MIKTTHLPVTLRGLFCSLGVIATASLLSSCQDEDLGYTAEQIAYRTNFEKMYGKIAEDQIWDFSSYNYYTMEQANGTKANGTRSGSDDSYHTTFSSNWIDVDPSLVKWLNDNMAEKQDHSAEVAQFNMSSNQEFYLLPIYQGQSSMMWDLYATKADGTEHKIWGKSDDLRYKTDYRMWEEYFYNPNSDVWANNGEYKLVKFGSAFSNFSQRSGDGWIEKDYAKIVFVVPAIDGKTANQTYLKGRFFFTYDDVYTQINSTNFPDFFTNNDNNLIENAGNGLFKFRADYNATINNGTLSGYTGGSGNQVDLKSLLYKTYTYWAPRKDGNGKEVKGEDGNTIYDQKTQTITDFSKLEFIIDDENWVDGNHSFNSYSGDRIRIFAKYAYTANDFTNLTTISGINTSSTTNSDGYFKAHTISKNHLQTKLIKINSASLGNQFKFNLKTTYVNEYDQRDGFAVNGDNHYSDKGAMNVIKYFSSSNDIFDSAKKTALKNTINSIIGSSATQLNDNYEYWVIGCEDANLQKGDKDFNDVVFLLIGNKLPKLSVTSIIEKRYMIEDLGSTHDFDFNDIVVDVTEEVTSLEDDNHYCIKQTAKIVNLCGTIPFLVQIGNVTIGDGRFMNGRLNYEPIEDGYKKVLVDTHVQGDYKNARVWDPSTNNIKVYVWPAKQNDGNQGMYHSEGATLQTVSGAVNNATPGMTQTVQLVSFPQTGKLPYIIATDQTVEWMGETISIPESWMKVKPEGYDTNGFTHGNQTYNPRGNVYEMWDLYNDAPVNCTPEGKDWQGLAIDKKAFDGAKAGDIVTVHVKYSGNSYSIGFKRPSDNWNAINGLGDNGNFYGNTGDYNLTLTNSIISEINSYNGLAINGSQCTITKVTLKHKK